MVKYKKIIAFSAAFLICTSMSLGTVPVSGKVTESAAGITAYALDVRDLHYSDNRLELDCIISNDQISIVLGTALSNGNIEIPATINSTKEYNVTSIKTKAFYYTHVPLESVKIPEGVTVIEDEAFLQQANLSMKSVYLPKNIESIGEKAFGYSFQGYNYGYTKSDDMVIYGYKGTVAETYALENEFKFVALDSEETTLPDWVPQNFDEAMEFDNKFGKTHISDGVICCVQKKSTNSIYTYETVDLGSTYNYTDNILLNESYSFEIPKAPDKSDTEAYEAYVEQLRQLGIEPGMLIDPQFFYEVTVYKAPTSGNINFNWIQKYEGRDEPIDEINLSFEVTTDGEVVETDIYGWLPDCIEEFKDFNKQNGTVSIHDGYIVYCDDVCYDGGYDVFLKQNGIAKTEQVLRYDVSRTYAISPVGGVGSTVIVYKPVTAGTVQMTWTQAREWEPEESAIDTDVKYYEIGTDLSIREIDESEFNKTVKGDVNVDGNVSVADLVMLQNYLVNKQTLTKSQGYRADMNGDNTVNVFDLCLIKRMVLEKPSDSISWELSSILYTNEFYDTIDKDYVITSTKELGDYFVSIYGSILMSDVMSNELELLNQYLEKYNDEFFEKNVLLLKPILQGSGSGINYAINSVEYDNDNLIISYVSTYENEPTTDIITAILAQVIIPKEQYHAQSVNWLLDIPAETLQ